MRNTVLRLHLERVGVFEPPRRDIVIQWQSGKLMLVLTVEGQTPYLEALLTQSSGNTLRVDLGGYIWANTKLSRRGARSLQKALELIDEHMVSIGIPAIRALQAALEYVHALSAEDAISHKEYLIT